MVRLAVAVCAFGSASALAPKGATTAYFKGRYDASSGAFKTEQLSAAAFDEFSLDEKASAAAAPAGQLYTADGAPLMTAPCCIKVVGVGGGGGNAVNRMVETDAGSFVDFWAMNTDAQASSRCYGAFTPSTRLVSRNDGSGWFLFRFRADSDRVETAVSHTGAVAVAGGEHDEYWPGDDARVGRGWDA